MLFQAGGDGDGSRLGPLDAEGQRANPAQCQVAVEGSGGSAQQHPSDSQLLGEVFVAGNEGAHQQIRVSAKGLGDAVHHDVGAQVQGRLQDRGGEGVVDEHQRPGVVRSRDAGGQIGDLQHRVCR